MKIPPPKKETKKMVVCLNVKGGRMFYRLLRFEWHNIIKIKKAYNEQTLNTVFLELSSQSFQK